MKRHDINTWAGTMGLNVIIKHRWIFLLLTLALVAFGAMGMQRIVMDSSNESFLPEGDDMLALNDHFEEIFGNEEFIFILVEAEDVFDHDVLTYIRALGEDLEENLPFIKEVTSLTTIEYTEAHDDTLYVDDLIGDEIPRDAESLQSIKQKALSKQMYVDRIVTQDAQKTGIAVSFEVIPDDIYAEVKSGFSPMDQVDWPAENVLMQGDLYTAEQMQRHPELTLRKVPDPRKLISPAFDVILARHLSQQCTVRATGMPIGDFTGDQIISSEGAKLGAIALIASIVLLFGIFRSLAAVMGPFLVLISTMVVVYGMMGWLNLPMSMSSIIIPPLLLVISVGYSIHVINHFRQAFQRNGIRREALRYAYQHSAWPCFLTALTTMLGFASFTIVPMKPIRDAGLLCALGAGITYILVMVVVPAFLSFGKDAPERCTSTGSDPTSGTENRFMIRWANMVAHNPLTIGVIALLLVIVLAGFSFKFRVESDFMELLGDKVRYIQDSRYITERLGGLYSYEVLIELPEAGQAKQPDVLQSMDVMAADVMTWEETTQTLSLTDIVKDLNATMHNSDDSFYRIPDNQELIAQYLLLYEMSGGDSVEDWVDYGYQKLRLSVQVNGASTSFSEKFDRLTHYTDRFPAGTTVSVVGDIPVMMRMVELLSHGQVKSVGAALIVITLIMMLILKSVRVGLISMIPNIFPIIAITGVMGILDYPLDMITVMIAPMIIGIAVDDTVHYIVHFKQEFESGQRCYLDANRHTFGKVGTAIVFTSVILTIGFAIFGLSVVQSLRHLALLSSVGILAALAADLFITPVLFVFFRPFGKKQAAEQSIELAKEPI